ncbi:MAG: BLUF domain-containing protein [Campylobacterales bacterium]|nr:BLUF domain-containing protein [Campylobacterales bacterium]
MNEAVKQEALIALLYISRGDPTLEFLEIQAILTLSARNNRARGLTGALIYDGTYFMQYLEGERAQIEALYAHIKKDPRHHDVTTVIHDPIDARRFEAWTMSDISGAFYLHVLPIVKTLPFDPYQATPEQLLRLVSKIVLMA